MGWANDRFRAELEAAGIRGANLTSEVDYSQFHVFGSYEYCVYVDGEFRGGVDDFNLSQNIKSTLMQYMPGHDVQIVALPVENHEWKSKKFEHWIAVVKEKDKYHIYRKFIAPEFELERLKTILSLRGEIVFIVPEKGVVDHGKSTRQYAGEDLC